MRSVGAAGVVALLLLLAACGGSGNQSSTLESAIMNDGASQLKANASSLAPGATVSMNDAHCVQTAGTQEYTCLAHYTVNDPSIGLNNQRYLLDISGTCDANASCQWHSTGNGQPVG